MSVHTISKRTVHGAARDLDQGLGSRLDAVLLALGWLLLLCAVVGLALMM